MTWSNPCAAAVAEAIAAVLGPEVPAQELKIDAPPRADLGDFAVGMFQAAKRLGQPPPALAARVAAALATDGVIRSATAAGPFVNVKVDRAWALRWLARGELIAPREVGQTICIDYSSPNISKHLAYHHIRSTMLGHALAQLHTALGARVVRINHVGDWGTTHGMLLAAYELWGAEYDGKLDIDALNDLYVRFRAAIKEDAAIEDKARGWFKRLEDGDAEARARWQQFRDVSMAEFADAYTTLGVEFDHSGGESFYEDKMPEIVEMLEARQLLSESEGATVVQLPDEKVPMLIRTKDGTTLYATRDLASALFRWREWRFDRSLYVVDRGQAHHFRQLFKTLGLLGFEWAPRCEHVPFGLVRFGGKKTSTRGAAGGAAGRFLLKDVFREATDRVRATIAEKNPEMPAAQLDETAEAVGIGAVVFANVLPQRDKDVDFEWDRVVSLTGDSGPYVQYTAARCKNVRRRAGNPPSQLATADWSLLVHDAEWAVARRLLDFGEHVARAAASSEPHLLAHYLLELAADFSRFYTMGNDDAALRILCDDPALRSARLGLTELIELALVDGLRMLGVRSPDQM